MKKGRRQRGEGKQRGRGRRLLLTAREERERERKRAGKREKAGGDGVRMVEVTSQHTLHPSPLPRHAHTSLLQPPRASDLREPPPCARPERKQAKRGSEWRWSCGVVRASLPASRLSRPDATVQRMARPMWYLPRQPQAFAPPPLASHLLA